MASELLRLMLEGMEKEERRSDKEISRALTLLESAAARQHAKEMQDDQQRFLREQQDDQQAHLEWMQGDRQFHEIDMAIKESNLRKEEYLYQTKTPTLAEARDMRKESEEMLLYNETQADEAMQNILAPIVNQFDFSNDDNVSDYVDSFKETFEDLKNEGDAIMGTKWLNAIVAAKTGDTSALTSLMRDLEDRSSTVSGFTTQIEKTDKDGNVYMEDVKLSPDDIITKDRHSNYINALHSLGLFGTDVETSMAQSSAVMDNIRQVKQVLNYIDQERDELRNTYIFDLQSDDVLRKKALTWDSAQMELPEYEDQDIYQIQEQGRQQALYDLISANNAGVNPNKGSIEANKESYQSSKATYYGAVESFKKQQEVAQGLMVNDYVLRTFRNIEPRIQKAIGRNKNVFDGSGRLTVDAQKFLISDKSKNIWKAGNKIMHNQMKGWSLRSDDTRLKMLSNWSQLKDELKKSMTLYDDSQKAKKSYFDIKKTYEQSLMNNLIP